MENSSAVRFNILIVDDDFTSLSIVSAMLKYWDCNVLTVRRPVEALAIVRILKNIDVVVTDLHMPEMNGLELQQQINEEFKNLPVMVMSSDDRESVVSKAIASGVVHFIVKPLNPADIKNVWQYTVASKNRKSINSEQIRRFGGVAESSASTFYLDDNVSSASDCGKKKKNRRDCKTKTSKYCMGKQQGETLMSAPKKVKVVWTNSLHNRFLLAIRYITLENAVPKKILDLMNVPGLKRENVASHLQKYRQFLKRVAQRGASKNIGHRSCFAADQSSMTEELREKQQQQPHGMMRFSPYSPAYGVGLSSINGSLGFPTSSNFHQSLAVNTPYILYQPNPGTTFGSGSIDKGANSLSRGYLSAAGIPQKNDRELVASDQIRLIGTAELSGNAIAHHLAESNVEENTALVSSPGLGGNHANNSDAINYDLMTTGAAAADGNAAQIEQFCDDMDIRDLLWDPSDYQFLFQQQGGDGEQNANSVTDQAQVNLPANESKNPDNSVAFALEDNAPNTWNEQTLQQLHEIEQILNQELGNNAANEHPSDDYYPNFNQNSNQLQEGTQNNLNISELNALHPPDSSSSGNQGWDDGFIDSLFENDPYCGDLGKI